MKSAHKFPSAKYAEMSVHHWAHQSFFFFSFFLCLVCACSTRSGPAPSPKTRTRVTTTPATASSFIWTQAMRFSLSWMGAKLTEATATNTAPSRGSSSTPTEGGLRSVRPPPEDSHFLAPAVGFTLPIATDPRSGFFFFFFPADALRSNTDVVTESVDPQLLVTVYLLITPSIAYRVPTPPFRRT